LTVRDSAGSADSTHRFSDRVADYVRYRPHYPEALRRALETEAGLCESSTVADVGCGTGISSSLLLAAGAAVYGIEPNEEMRRAAEALLGADDRFHSVTGTAEATKLPDASVDLVTAGQAFHWFDRARFRAEADRILRPGGRVALFWNKRRTDSTPFLRAYEDLLRRYGTDYAEVDHARLGPDDFAAFFGGSYASHRFQNEQRFDFEGLRGRLLSSSYAPGLGQPDHEPMLGALRQLFDAHQEDGEVRFEYDTELYFA